jgi:hypothetical protein
VGKVSQKSAAGMLAILVRRGQWVSPCNKKLLTAKDAKKIREGREEKL